MKKLFILLMLATPMVGFSQSFNLNTKTAKVYFNYVSEKTKGTLSDVQTKININASDLSSSSVTGTVNVNTLTTGNKTRDKHLQSADFFDAANHPTMSFTSSSIVKEGEFYNANGTLTIKGVTKEVTFKVKSTEESISFTTSIYGTDFGVSVKDAREKSLIKIKVAMAL